MINAKDITNEPYLNLRPELTEKVTSELKAGNHVLLLGSHGIGKSRFSQELATVQGRLFIKEKWVYCFFCNPATQVIKFALEELADSESQYKEYAKGTTLDLAFKLMEVLEQKDLKLVIVIDEIHTITGASAAIYNILMQRCKRLSFLAIGNPQYLDTRLKKPECKRFFWELKHFEVNALSELESIKLAKKLFKHYKIQETNKSESELKRIICQGNGNALAIKKAVQSLSVDEANWPHHEALRDKPINLFPVIMLGIFIIFGLRYLYRGVGDYETANFVSFFGLIMMFITRYFMMRKRKW